MMKALFQITLNYNPQIEIKLFHFWININYCKKSLLLEPVTEQKIYIIELLKELNIKFIFHNRHTSSYKPFFNVEPSEFTVVLIQGKFRLGNQLNKQYICGVLNLLTK